VLHEIEQLTRRILLIHHGRLLAEGEVGEIRSLIDRHPLQVQIRTPRSRELAALLAADTTVREIILEADLLRVRTSDASGFYERLTRLVAEKEFPVEELASPDDNLESVFRYLIQ
jgi:ABC-2 type transport system ATP-binding protein